MSAIRFIEDFRSVKELVQELNSYRGSGLILCSRKVLQTAGISEEDASETLANYAFGGEADIWVDLAISPDHFIFTYLKEHRDG